MSGSSAVMKRDRAESFDRGIEVRPIATLPNDSLLEARRALFDRMPSLSSSLLQHLAALQPFRLRGRPDMRASIDGAFLGKQGVQRRRYSHSHDEISHVRIKVTVRTVVHTPAVHGEVAISFE
jgi:hypothetical protein